MHGIWILVPFILAYAASSAQFLSAINGIRRYFLYLCEGEWSRVHSSWNILGLSLRWNVTKYSSNDDCLLSFKWQNGGPRIAWEFGEYVFQNWLCLSQHPSHMLRLTLWTLGYLTTIFSLPAQLVGGRSLFLSAPYLGIYAMIPLLNIYWFQYFWTGFLKMILIGIVSLHLFRSYFLHKC